MLLQELCSSEPQQNHFRLLFESVRVNHTKGLVSYPRAHSDFGLRAPSERDAMWLRGLGLALSTPPTTCSHAAKGWRLSTGRVILRGKGSLGTGWDPVPCALAAISEDLMRHQGNYRSEGLASPLSQSSGHTAADQTVSLTTIITVSLLVPYGPGTVLILYPSSQQPDSSWIFFFFLSRTTPVA